MSAVISYLTVEELEAMDASVALSNALARVVGRGPQRDNDLRELFGHVHAIQHAVMAQAVARLFPSEYRLLGEEIEE